MECIFADDACAGAVVYAPDPYEQDVNGDDTPVWMCEFHIHIQIMEI